MLRFRHSPIVRTLALLLTLNLTLWGCSTGSQSHGPTFFQPVAVDSVLLEFGKETTERGQTLYVQVTLTDSALVSLDGSGPVFRGGEVAVLWDLSSRADTLFGVGGPPGPGVKSAYVIPPSEIAVLEITGPPDEGGGAKVAYITAGIVLVGLLIFAITQIDYDLYGSD